MKKYKYMVDIISYLPITILVEVEASNKREAKELAKKFPPKKIVDQCFNELKDPTNLVENLFYAERDTVVLGKSDEF